MLSSHYMLLLSVVKFPNSSEEEWKNPGQGQDKTAKKTAIFKLDSEQGEQGRGGFTVEGQW